MLIATVFFSYSLQAGARGIWSEKVADIYCGYGQIEHLRIFVNARAGGVSLRHPIMLAMLCPTLRNKTKLIRTSQL
jgi:hypothetical protein